MVSATKKSSLKRYSDLGETEDCSKSYSESLGEPFGGTAVNMAVTEGVLYTGAPIRDASAAIPDFDSNAVCEIAHIDGGFRAPIPDTFASTSWRKICGDDGNTTCEDVRRGDDGNIACEDACGAGTLNASGCCTFTSVLFGTIPALDSTAPSEGVRGDYGSKASGFGAIITMPCQQTLGPGNEATCTGVQVAALIDADSPAADCCTVPGLDSATTCQNALGVDGSRGTSTLISHGEGALPTVKGEDGTVSTTDPSETIPAPNSVTVPHIMSPLGGIQGVLTKATLAMVDSALYNK